MAIVKNVDMRFDFEFVLKFERLNDFSPEGHAAFLHPSVLNDALAAGGRGVQIVAEIEQELKAKLNSPPAEFEIERVQEDMNLRLRLKLSQVSYNREKLPDRFGSIHGPERSGQRPECIFATIVDNVIEKAKKGQALQVSDADAAVLVVDLAESDLFTELRSEIYRNDIFLPLIQQKIGENRRDHTAFVFCDSAGWGEPFVSWLAVYDEAASKDLHDLLDPRRAVIK